jgi:hypothetical protein
MGVISASCWNIWGALAKVAALLVWAVLPCLLLQGKKLHFKLFLFLQQEMQSRCVLSVTDTQLSLYVTYAAALFLHLQQVSIAVRINHNYFSKSVCFAFLWTRLSSWLWVGLFHGQLSRYHQSNIVCHSPAPNACTFFILWKQERDVIFDGGTEQSIHIVILASLLMRPPSVKHDAVPYGFRKWINVTDGLLFVRNWRCYETLNKRGITLWPVSSKQ